ncbi:MAG TPA: pilus assembly protein PilM [Acidobacteriota bacterium]|nr:pilus assembly protein PilM [Acidobacteriota bacterium]
MIYLKTSVGIELRGEDLLISSLQSNFSGGVFTHFKRIAGYKQRDRESLRQEVLSFFRSAGLSKDNVVLGIPRADIVLRYLDLPSEIEGNLKQVIQYQVQSFEPTEEDKYYYDYSLIGGSGSPKKLSILLAMVKKGTLDEYLRLLRGFEIRPVIVSGSSMGLANIFLHNRKDLQDKIFILADLKASSVEVLALKHGTIAYSREVPKGDEQSWKDLLLREIDEATSKIRLSSESSLEQIVLAGESSDSAYQEIKSVIPDCKLMKGFIPGEVPGENKEHLQEAASTLGLAYSGVTGNLSIKLNLLPDDLRMHQTRWAYVPAAILGLAIVALLLGLGFHRTIQNRILLRNLDQQILALKGPVERAQSFRSQADAMGKRIQSVEELLRSKDMNLEILREITSILPPDTYLNTYSNRDGIIQIGGYSGAPYELIPKLEKSPLLKDVVQRGSILRDTQTGKDHFIFEMKLEK